ncbi:MAG: DNA-processing protein DprA [Clostridia bacterium]|nr:DNA-processing protein DprA [Clostridia bacterium]
MDINILRNDEMPDKLKEVKPQIKQLYYKGNIENLSMPSIAIIGSRSCTSQGMRIAKNISKSLTRAGFCIISGMAKGIDSAAHMGCLEAGGKTIAVMRRWIWTYIPKRKYWIV